MAAITERQQSLLPSLNETTPCAWLERFTASQREELLRDDRFAGTSIALILGSIFLVGLLLSAVVVVLSG